MESKESALAELLLSFFSASELQRFVRYGPEGTALSQQLPERSSPAAQAHAVVDLYQSRGMIQSDLFDRLRGERSRRKLEVDRVEGLWASQPGTTGPGKHVAKSPASPPATKATAKVAAKVFVSYSHKDRAFVDELSSHLKLLERQGVVEVWTDGDITAGEEWKGAIDSALVQADIILLLVSASFLASDFCWGVELEHAMQRHDGGSAIVIPVFVRACLWDDSPFAKIQGVPRDAKPISERPDTDSAWVEVARAIRSAATSLGNRSH